MLTVLRVRGIAVPEVARKRILAQKDLHRLERWLEKASVATSLGDVMGEVERSGRRSPRVPAQR